MFYLLSILVCLSEEKLIKIIIKFNNEMNLPFDASQSRMSVLSRQKQSTTPSRLE